MTLALNQNVFFIFDSNRFVVWNYLSHEQYEIDVAHFSALRSYVEDGTLPEQEILSSLINAGVIVDGDGNPSPPEWRWDSLARIFHIGTSSSRPLDMDRNPEAESAEYVKKCTSKIGSMPSDSFSYERGRDVIALDPLHASILDAGIKAVLANRTTTRRFTGESIPLSKLNTILTETFFYRDHLMHKFHARKLDTPTRRRSSPSGGSLQCSEAYLIARNVSGLAAGIYHYRSHNSTLGLVSELPREFRFGDYLAGQYFGDDADAFVVVTSRLEKMWWKYDHSRAYRVALMDVGHLSQTAQLVATGLGVRTWITGMFFDEQLRELLKIDGASTEYPLLVLGFGTGEVDPVDKYYVPATDGSLQHYTPD